ncbi:hypothetical protein OHS33_34625 [Streptomyces sp. NBC_00536]|uniref:hypothetical protein n=1 Tax=Streptomyces sp. NBC_00536 TaxID=2975769 RepID=UPI002E81145F|nr:hypothetical protein [Streptomyces sp. NBC_00536]WUC83055.1 hypothetical protein OHS33_34625 [Streptomyces sp. NBC_00536]
MGSVPDGVYHIKFNGDQFLTVGEEGAVTLLPARDDRQKFEVRRTPGGNYAISKASSIWPSPFVCYDGAPATPYEGARLRVRVSDFPTCEWKITEGSQPGTFTIVVAGDGQPLTVGIAPIAIFPPFLQLTSGSDEDLGWTFEEAK